MPTFIYRRTQEMTPRPGVKYATVYIKQSADEYQRLKNWLVETAESIVAACAVDASLAEWFVRPMPDFRRAQRGEYYSPEHILTDMIDQMVHGRDLTSAMLSRWNRLTEGTPWQIELVESTGAKTSAHDQARALFS